MCGRHHTKNEGFCNTKSKQYFGFHISNRKLLKRGRVDANSSILYEQCYCKGIT